LKLAVSHKKIADCPPLAEPHKRRNSPRWRRSSSKRLRLDEEADMKKALTVVLEDKDIPSRF